MTRRFGALLLVASISPSAAARSADPFTSDVEFQALGADYFYCAYQKAELLATTTRDATAAVVEASIAACGEKRRAVAQWLRAKAKLAAGLPEKDVELLVGQMSARLDKVIRASVTMEVIERRAARPAVQRGSLLDCEDQALFAFATTGPRTIATRTT